MAQLRVYRDGGVVVEKGGKRILLDPRALPRTKPDVIFVSHAHRDHYSLRALRALSRIPKVMSRATRDLIDPRGTLSNVVVAEAGEVVEVGGLALELYDAGHVLGSLQVRVDLGESVVFTGDFNLDRRIVLRPAPILRADVLIIDATYGHPRYCFPPRGELYRRLLAIVKRSVEAGDRAVLAARTLGTGQELTALLSLSAKLTPLVERRVAARNRVYEKYGEILGNYAVLTREPPPGSAAVVPLSASSRGAIQCTGWAIEAGIPLSSHSDFDDLVEYVKRSGACEVYAAYGFTSAFSSYLRRFMGLDAIPL